MATSAYTIADLHLGHIGAATIRGLTTVHEHDEMVVDAINSVVNPKDSLYLLGDIVVTDEGLIGLSKINCCNLYLVPGNHCGERAPIRHAMFNRVMGAYVRRLPGTRHQAVFTHMPIHPQCLDRWQFNVHGHLHSETITDPRFLCVSCEQLNYKPISMVEIGQIFESRGLYGKNNTNV